MSSELKQVPQNEMEQLQILIESKALPANIKTIEQAWTIAQYGKELGMKPMQAFHQVYSIQGRLSLSSKGLASLLWANGIQMKTIQDFEKISTGKDDKGNETFDRVTTIEFYRGKVTEVASFHYSDAVRAGWHTKDTWVKMPKQMLWARCLSLGANRIAPDKVLGLYTVEEMVDVTDAKDVKINEEGEVTIIG
ncbi:MAG: hypothetical protein E6R13_06225 [Spirochaetes bacterium]|nr:MAG: hypothetical protein E6R13_06225 [Spirochaetota bacterium]